MKFWESVLAQARKKLESPISVSRRENTRIEEVRKKASAALQEHYKRLSQATYAQLVAGQATSKAVQALPSSLFDAQLAQHKLQAELLKQQILLNQFTAAKGQTTSPEAAPKEE